MLSTEAPDFPRRLTLELTNQCNYRCSMCPSRFDRTWPRGFMSGELFRRIVDEAAQNCPVALVPFFRGESTMHPELVVFLEYAGKKGLKPIQLATNASLLTGKMSRGILDAGIDFISFSLDTIRPEEYAAIRIGGQLETVLANILRFLDLRNREGYSTQVQISATRTERNRIGIDELVRYWRPLADRVRIYYEHSTDGNTGSLNCPEMPLDMPRRPCHKVFHDLVVYWDGRAAACNHDWFRTDALGDLNHRTVREVWHGRLYEDLRLQHAEPWRMTDSTCLGCDHWKIGYLDQPFIGELYTFESVYDEANQAAS